MWHVLQTAPHCESQVSRFLNSQGLRSYAPQFPESWNSRSGSSREPSGRWVFPNYVFFRVPPDFGRWDLIRWGPGIRQVLQVDGSPAVLDDEVVDRVRLRLPTHAVGPATLLAPGQRVTVESGPLRMVDAIFERKLERGTRVQILIELLGRPLTVEVDSTILRPIG